MVRPFRVKNGIFVGVLATVMAGVMVLMYVIPGTNCALIWQEWVIVGGWSVIGLLLAMTAKAIYKDKFCSGMNVE